MPAFSKPDPKTLVLESGSGSSGNCGQIYQDLVATEDSEDGGDGGGSDEEKEELKR